jgi:hypothetical protein
VLPNVVKTGHSEKRRGNLFKTHTLEGIAALLRTSQRPKFIFSILNPGRDPFYIYPRLVEIIKPLKPTMSGLKINRSQRLF